FQTQFHLTSSQNGYLFMIYSAGIVIGSWLTKRCLSRATPEKILMVSLPLLVAFTLLASLSVHFTSVLSIGFIVIYSFAVGLGCGLSSPLLLGISLHGHADLAGTGSALQGALKMAGAALVLWFFASGRTGTASGLLSGLFLLSLICLVLIAFAQFWTAQSVHQQSSPDRD
ncbi:TPA: Bcr/CflA family drug resistance efflux transporter, partial [Klebsiella quasipneumoniae subsp. similipneumoniae]|nr:Bcr/CflA family drug resistance efflux transporter [Klebsiella quasipneumoniae subsp. similipneumoniae]